MTTPAMPERFTKKPVTIEAVQFNNDESSYALIRWINEGQLAAGRCFASWQNNELIVPTLEGEHIASPGDWIIRGVKGEFYPCKPDIFEMTYDLAALSSQPSPEQAVVSDACTAPTIEAAREMGAKGGPVVEAERLAFEAWMAGHCWKVSPTWNGQTYDDSEEEKKRGLLDPLARMTRMLWAAWRDRAALRPAQQAVPMTLEPTNDVGLVPVVIKPFTPAQRRRLWYNSPEIHKDAASITGFERIVSLTERAHGITAPAGGEKQA